MFVAFVLEQFFLPPIGRQSCQIEVPTAYASYWLEILHISANLLQLDCSENKTLFASTL
jgi:hypothetical protein